MNIRIQGTNRYMQELLASNILQFKQISGLE
jgi:hypothetical protein